MKRKMMQWAMLPALFAALTFVGCQKDMDASKDGDVGQFKKEGTFDALTLSCGTATASSVDLVVTAGLSGAPAGFSVQWMTQTAYDAFLADPANDGYDWPMDWEVYEMINEVSTLVGYNYCKASFSGVPKESTYNLGPGESITVTVGMGGTMCDDALVCGTDLVFRAFAHANKGYKRSDYTIYDGCSTSACPQ